MLFLIQVFVLACFCWILFFAVFEKPPIDDQLSTSDSGDAKSLRIRFNWGPPNFESYKYKRILTAIDYVFRLATNSLVWVLVTICGMLWFFTIGALKGGQSGEDDTDSNYDDEAIERRTTENVYDHAGRDITSEEDRFNAKLEDDFNFASDYEQHNQSFEDDNRPF